MKKLINKIGVITFSLLPIVAIASTPSSSSNSVSQKFKLTQSFKTNLKKSFKNSKWVGQTQSNSNNNITYGVGGTIFEDSRGNLWSMGRRTPLQKYNYNTKKWTTETRNSSGSNIISGLDGTIFEDSRGNLWSMGYETPLQKYNYQTQKWTAETSGSSGSNITDGGSGTIFEDSRGNLWSMGAGTPLQKYDYQTKRWTTETKESSGSNIISGLSGNIFEDSRGNLWAMAWLTRPQKYNYETERWTTRANYRNINDGLDGTIFEDSRGNLWSMWWLTPLQKYNYNTQKWTTESRNISGSNITDGRGGTIFEDSRGNLWSMGNGTPLQKYDYQTKKWTAETKESSGSNITDGAGGTIFEDSRGNLWSMGRGTPLQKYNYNTKKWTTEAKESSGSNIISGVGGTIFEDSRGNLWSMGGGTPLQKITPKKDICLDDQKIKYYNLTFKTKTNLDSKIVISIKGYKKYTSNLFTHLRYRKKTESSWKIVKKRTMILDAAEYEFKWVLGTEETLASGQKFPQKIIMKSDGAIKISFIQPSDIAKVKAFLNNLSSQVISSLVNNSKLITAVTKLEVLKLIQATSGYNELTINQQALVTKDLISLSEEAAGTLKVTITFENKTYELIKDGFKLTLQAEANKFKDFTSSDTTKSNAAVLKASFKNVLNIFEKINGYQKPTNLASDIFITKVIVKNALDLQTQKVTFQLTISRQGEKPIKKDVKVKFKDLNVSNINNEPFNTFEDAKKVFNNQVFKYLLRTVFKKFKDSSSAKYYLEKRWLAYQFERILNSIDKDSDMYNALFATARFYYYHNPFDFETRVTQVFYNFFQNHSDFKAEILNKPQVSNDYTNDPFNAIKSHFFTNGKFLTFLKKDLKKNKQVKDIIRDILWNEIEIFLKASDPAYQKRDDSALYNWVKNKFDYTQMQQAGLNATYDFYFKSVRTSEKILNVSKADFKTKFIEEVAKSLLSSGHDRPPLTQVVYYYLLVDMINYKLFTPIVKGNYKDAKRLVDSYYANLNSNSLLIDLINNLNIFLLRIKQQITNFGFNWKTKNKDYGLIFEKDEPNEFLTPRDATKSIYNFRFKFRFATSYVNESIQNSNANLFKLNIPIETKISDFQKAKNIVDNFVEQGIIWKQGYMNQSLWTEKDIVDWISDFNTIEDFKNFIKVGKDIESSFEKTISLLDWPKFSPSNLQKINFSIINSSNFIFKVLPIAIFDVNPQDFKKHESGANETTPNYFGKVRVILRLFQYSKNCKKDDLPKKVDIEIRPSSEVLTMLKLINEKIREKFPIFLHFQNKKAPKHQVSQFVISGREASTNFPSDIPAFDNTEFIKSIEKFWLNEFIDEYGNSVQKLNTEENFKLRSNIKEMQNFANVLVAKINWEYRDNFQVIPKLLIEDNSNGLPGKKITLSLSLFDALILKKKHYTKILDTNKMDSLGWLESGEFEGKKGAAFLLNEKFSKARPWKTLSYKEPKHGEKIGKDFIFLVGDQKYTIKEIENEIEKAGFKVQNSHLRHEWVMPFNSKNKRNLKDKFIEIRYRTFYYNYYRNEPAFYYNFLRIYIYREIVPPEQIERGYQEFIKNIPDKNKKDKLFLKMIEAIFSQLRKNGLNEWRNDVSSSEYRQVIDDAMALILGTTPREDITKEIKKIYDNQIPKIVLEKLSDPKYTEIIKEIIKQKDHLPVKKILENAKLLDILNKLNKQGEKNFSNLINRTLKVTKNVKYSYFGIGLGFGVLSLLAGVTSIRSLKLNKKAKVVSTSFKKSRYIAPLSLGASVISALASIALMLIFFIEKSGF